LFCSTLSLESARSPFRKIDCRQPTITMKSKKNLKKKYKRSDWYYYKDPLFTVFDEDFFFKHLLPEAGIILPQDGKNSMHVSFTELSEMLEVLVQEVKDEKNTYQYFKLIQNKN